jgi:SAM-dependent methyltransferase
VQQLIGSVVRNRRFQLRSARVRGLRYIDLGCGRNPHREFVNMDFEWHPAVDLCWDIRCGLPFEDASLSGIFTEHCLEHFDLPCVRTILRECRRVLAPGGTVRIVVPDIEAYLRTYCRRLDGDVSPQFPYPEQELIDGSRSPVLCVNRVFYQDRDSPAGHRFMFDRHILELLLREVGFDRVAPRTYRDGQDPLLLIDSLARAAESLYIEASVVERTSRE